MIGSDHESPKSWAEIKAVIQFVKPEAVFFLELCASRRHILTHDKIEMPTLQDMVHMWEKYESLYSILFKRYVAQLFIKYKYEHVPGGDFLTAYIEATKYGAKVILGDRPVEITTLRHWANTSLWQTYMKYKRPHMMLPEDLAKKVKEAQKTGKVDADTVKQVICEMTKQDPIGSKIIIHERDQYMSFKLLEVARQHKSVVAVVGRGHVPGIQNNWKQHVEVEQLLNVPLRKKMLRIATRVAQVACLYGTYLYFDELKQGCLSL
ncbi:traB domain-containing protein-like isoform X2 [Salvia hispanica]|uniref:traB domain-containing protein-like isoform X2 n=1 Tax=Salvia hispanica TaxID=49212 RepID=UPI0020099D89|nr:traB domain-containing protein-like isoform X2 [Salvia hispanica]